MKSKALNNLHEYIMTNETEIINVYPTKTRSGLDRLTSKSYQYFTIKEGKASMLLYQFCKT